MERMYTTAVEPPPVAPDDAGTAGSQIRRSENWVEGRGGLGSPFSNPPPAHYGLLICLLTMPGGGGGFGTPTYIPQNDTRDALTF